MFEAIRNGAAWFTTRKDKYVRIGYSQEDDCYFARECFFRDGVLEGGAYSFGTDWFDISFHGRRIDIYADPDTFRCWEIFYDPQKGTYCKDRDNQSGQFKRLYEFCRRADKEALAGIRDPYEIDGTNFEVIIELSEDGKQGEKE